MKHLLPLLFFSWSTSPIFSQDYAYYIGDYNQRADLYQIKLDYGIFELQEAHSFGDSVEQVENGYLSGINTLFFFPSLGDGTKITKSEGRNFGFYEIHTYDSVQLRNQWFTIHTYFSDDQFIGGRPNAINKRITARGLGVIYSSSNPFGDHTLIMLNNSDSTKQALLELVYQKLASINNWMDWKTCAELASTYHYSNCLIDLSKRWMENRKDLRLVETTIRCVTDRVYYSAKIVNNSNKRYVLPENTAIGPASYLYERDSKTFSQKLTDDYYGPFFQRQNKELRLEPKDTLSFSYEFNIHGNAKAYEGFQFNTAVSLLDWLLMKRVMFDHKEYQIFRYREVLK